ncbi:MAG TPA: hypothetical protein VE988_00995 [Gemmataceae bacterium]|nr:hypothetical protein [Gemmataceae bacterium]
MDNTHNHDIAAGAAPPQSLFADETTGPLAQHGAKPPAPVKRPFNVLTRIVLPAGILLGGIAFIAWVAQYLPSSGRNRSTDKANTAVVDPIRFEGLAARGDVLAQFFPGDDANKGYDPEYELGTGGHYDFPFTNTSEAAAELGVLEINCACSGVEVCLFQGSQREDYEKTKQAKPDLKWQALEPDKDLKKLITVPPQGAGLLRITWRGTKTEPEPLWLIAKAWGRPAGSNRYPTVSRLAVRVNYVRAVQFEDTRIDFGSLQPQGEHTEGFVCWSATSDIDVKSASEDPRIKVVIEKLDAKACAAEQKRLREVEKIMTRVRTAFKVTVTLYEQRDGAQLDMGYFAKPVPLTITSNGRPIEGSLPIPMLRAHVGGPVYLSPQEEGGRIDFKAIKVKLGANKKVTLFSKVKGVKLTYVDCDPSWFAPSVTLKEVKVEGDKTQWEMDVAIKPDPDGQGYALPENSHLTLECELPGVGSAPPVKRIVRIAIAATVGSH